MPWLEAPIRRQHEERAQEPAPPKKHSFREDRPLHRPKNINLLEPGSAEQLGRAEFGSATRSRHGTGSHNTRGKLHRPSLTPFLIGPPLKPLMPTKHNRRSDRPLLNTHRRARYLPAQKDLVRL